jgi:riboflavin kinase/FMN adenylyltransferase
MKSWRDYRHTPTSYKGAVVALGNFDGIHLGHQALLNYTQTLAKQTSVPALVMSFHPYPYHFFHPGHAQERLMHLYDRFYALRKLGLDGVLMQRFDPAFSMLTATQFIEKVLIEAMAISHVVVGEDFTFGHQRQGTVQTLRSAGVKVTAIASVGSESGDKYSSSAVRQMLRQAQLEEAALILGRPYEFSGRVIRGQQLGRQLGFPTANLAVQCAEMLPYGVYAAQVILPGHETVLPAVANLGIRPTVHGQHPQWDVHILHPDVPSLYGQRICLKLDRYLRSEQRFASLDELRQAIDADINNVTRR